MDSTPKSAPIVCQCLQCADRQPATCNRGETLSGGLFPGLFSLATEKARAAGGPRKGRLTFATPLLLTRLGRERGGGRRSILLRPLNHGGNTAMVGGGIQRKHCLGQSSRRFARNLRRMQRPLNKSVVRSCTHLGQGRVKQKNRKNTRRRGKVCITQACDLFSWDRRPGIHKKGILVGQHEVAESRDALGTQELQVSRPREHQPFEVATDFVR